MEWMLMPYRRYAEFGGRSRRKEYWMFFLLAIIVYAVCMMLISTGAPTIDPATGVMTGGGGALATVGSGIYLLFALGSLVPSIACGVRRMHDVDKSGWFLLIPIYNLILACTEGTKGPNRFGADPKAGEA